MDDYFTELFHSNGPGIPARFAMPTTDRARIALHQEMWPRAIDVEGKFAAMVSHERFECAELAFRDLDRDGIVFPNGSAKVVELLPSASGVMRAKNGMTAGEVDALMEAWKARMPDSVFADIYWVRLLNAAAWQARGFGPATEVGAEQWALFKSLNREAEVRMGKASPNAKAHRLWPYVVVRVMADIGTSQARLESYALERLRVFPEEVDYLLAPALRLTERWGGTPANFERFAQKALTATSSTHGHKAYARLYMKLLPIQLLSANKYVQVDTLRAGLFESLQGPFSAEDFNNLQAFACALNDKQAYLHANSLWNSLSIEQRSAVAPISASCRAWSLLNFNDSKK